MGRSPSGPFKSSVYPLHPPGTKVLARTSPDITAIDRLIVASSSLAIVGSVFWVPFVARWAYRRWKSATDTRKRALYGSILLSIALVTVGGPHRNPSFGNWIKFRQWRFLQAWVKFIALEILSDQPKPTAVDIRNDKVIYAFVPHGVFPFAFAFGVVPDVATKVFGFTRPVVATAIRLFPIVSDFVSWFGAV